MAFPKRLLVLGMLVSLFVLNLPSLALGAGGGDFEMGTSTDPGVGPSPLLHRGI